MKQVIQPFGSTGAKTRISVLRLEIDYELANLYDALMAKDLNTINKCKRKLEKLRQELIGLEG